MQLYLNHMWYLVKVGSSALFHREFASWPFSFKNTAKKRRGFVKEARNQRYVLKIENLQ